jgi:alpha-2-macroglobulin
MPAPMRTLALVPVLLLAVSASAQTGNGAFDAADKYLTEQSNSRACDAFVKFLKDNPEGPLTREAQAKRAFTCMNAGKGGTYYQELRDLADKGEKDFARAWAMWVLGERGERQPADALPLLKQAAGGEGRTAKEARRLYIAASFRAIERNSWDMKQVSARVDGILEMSESAAEKARARFLRGQSQLNNGQPAGEKELLEVGSGSSDWADDALYAVAQQRENQGKYVPALELYDQIVQRFDRQKSNLRDSAASRAADIRRPSINLNVTWFELPGSKPQVTVSFRNVKKSSWSIKRADPGKLNADYASDMKRALAESASETVKTWELALKEPAPHAPGNTTFELELTQAGTYVVDVDAEGQKDREIASIGPNVLVVKTGRDDLVVWHVDSNSGEAVPNSPVHIYARDTRGKSTHLTGTTDATGLARFSWKGTERLYQVVAWAQSGQAWAYANTHSNWYAYNKEHLAYVLSDRPLYKPGEEVGLKLFVRSREDGPSVPVPDAKCTLYVRDPSGRDIAHPELTTNKFGTAFASFKLGKDAQLGPWSGYISCQNVSPQQSQLSFRVEEYKPPEYTVSVSPVGRPKPGDAVKVKVAASFFFGGPVANAQGRAIVRVTGWNHQWAPWPEDVMPAWMMQYGYGRYGGHGKHGRRHYDDDEYGGGYGYYGQLATHTLQFKTGADGTAEIEVPALQNGANQPGLQYQVEVLVTDSSRREVRGTGTVKVSKEAYFADLRTDRLLYRPGEKMTVQLRAEDPNGVPAAPELKVRVARLTEKGVEGQVAEGKAKLAGGKGSLSLPVDAIGPVRVELYDGAAGDKVLATADVWLTDDKKPIVPNRQGFFILTDRGPMKVGQSVRALVVTARPGGHTLLSLETEKMNHVVSVPMNGRSRFVELPVTADLAPNAWLTASRVENQNFQQQQETLLVTGSDVELDVKVAPAKAVTEPSTAMGLTVDPGARAPKGAGFEVALTAVDEALFAIEPEKTDTFVPWFGRRMRQHAVQTSSSLNWKSYRPPRQQAQPITQAAPEEEHRKRDESAGDMKEKSARAGAGMAMAPAALAAPEPAKKMSAKDSKPSESKAELAMDDDRGAGPGGAKNAAEAPVKVRSDFGSSAGWQPALAGSVGAPAKSQVKFTDSLTSWRLIAIVVTDGPHLGIGRATVRTEKPLMVRLQAPRFFVEKDQVVLSAIVSSRLPTAAEVDVSISAPGLKALQPTSKKVTVGPGANVRFDARFEVIDPGDRVVKAVARGGGKADAMEWTLPASVHGAAQRQFWAGRVGDKMGFTFELPEKRKATATKLELTLSPSLLAVMFDGLPYLAQYPYGCTEQTLSKFVPAAIARRAVKDLSLPEGRVPANLDDMVSSGLNRLYGFQHGDGGWGWWQTDKSNQWMTAYAVYGLSLGKDAGLAVDQNAIERGRGWLRDNLGSALNAPETHAFMVFALAQTGGAPKHALDSTFGYRTKLSPKGRALVAMSLLAANDKRARIAVENLDDVVKMAKERADAAVGDAKDAWSTSAAIEATSAVLMAMVRYDVNSPLIKPLVDFLVLRRNGGKWRTTRDTAFAIYALSELARKEAAQLQTGSFSILVNGKEVKRVKYQKGGLDLTEPVLLADSAFRAGKNEVQIRRDGAGTGYYAALLDLYNQDDVIKGRGGDVVVKRSYTLLGRPSTERAQAPTEFGMPVDSGVRVRVDLEVTINKAVEFVMIEDLKPAGLESVLQKSGPEVCAYACTHAELRNDRVAMFLTELPVGTKKLSYELRAEVPGRFSALPARVEAMYAPEITATSDEFRFEVRDAPEAGVAGK